MIFFRGKTDSSERHFECTKQKTERGYDVLAFISIIQGCV